MVVTKKAKIRRIKYDDLIFCSSRVISAILVDENGEEYHVEWASTPMISGPTVSVASRNQDSFVRVWKKCKAGDTVRLYHAADQSFNYFEPE